MSSPHPGQEPAPIDELAKRRARKPPGGDGFDDYVEVEALVREAFGQVLMRLVVVMIVVAVLVYIALATLQAVFLTCSAFTFEGARETMTTWYSVEPHVSPVCALKLEDPTPYVWRVPLEVEP